MTARNLLTEIYVSEEIKDVLQRLEPKDLQDDIKQYVFTELLVMEEGFIVDLHRRGKLKHFIVKMLYNTSKWRDRSAFKKQYGFLEISVENFDRSNTVDAAENYNFDGIAAIDLNDIIKTSADLKVCDDNKTQNEIVEEILLALKEMYWYKAEVFKLYVRLGTYQKVADVTRIPISSIYKTVTQAKQEIKNYIQ